MTSRSAAERERNLLENSVEANRDMRESPLDLREVVGGGLLLSTVDCIIPNTGFFLGEEREDLLGD